MNIGLFVQYALVGLIVLVSAWVAFCKLAPQLTHRWFAAASISLGRRGRSRLAGTLARCLQPKEATGNCSDGCASCRACGPKKPAGAIPGGMPVSVTQRDGEGVAVVDPLPLNFRQRPHLH